ncbi:unnamed protein product [Dovyalis caffra]|uniref:Uncharacterized protein n=1 Tax=Dovyalis caffra TaxID=77055 RepID=A0AAV1SJB6_9ROSI|nr:unnamed protein product [Dovyalis caffra]
MANRKILIFSFLAVAILVLSTLVQSSNASSHDRVLLARQRNAARSQIPNCSKMVSRSQCSQNPKCKWCKSEVLDDMCFSKAEAWRLPQQASGFMVEDRICLVTLCLKSKFRALGFQIGIDIVEFVFGYLELDLRFESYVRMSSHCDQEAKLLQDNPDQGASAEQQSSSKPRPCSLFTSSHGEKVRCIAKNGGKLQTLALSHGLKFAGHFGFSEVEPDPID